MRQPLYEMHEAQGRLVGTVDVDHRTPIGDGVGSFDDPKNLRSLCHECHSRVTRAWQQGKP